METFQQTFMGRKKLWKLLSLAKERRITILDWGFTAPRARHLQKNEQFPLLEMDFQTDIHWTQNI